MHVRLARKPLVMTLFMLLAVVCNSGCVGLISHLGYWSGGSMVPAAYEGLAGQRVAVVCVSDATSYGTGGESDILARMVALSLAEHVPDIEVVPAAEIADWDDRNDWDEVDYREVGEGVKADRVVAIDLEGLQLHEGQSLYKGSATVSISVFDMNKNGREVFRRQLTDLTYPTNGFYHTTETTERKFRRAFLTVIARRTATHFYEYDALDEFGPDPAGVR